MKLGKAQLVIIGICTVFFCFTLGYFSGRRSVHTVVTTEKVPELSEPVPIEEASPSVPEETPPVVHEEQINLNTASLEDLVSLPGIGEVLAQRILDWRKENGGFVSVEQLKDVDGIGKVKYDEVKAYLYVEETP